MAANQYFNKIIINGETKIDLTGDTVTAQQLLKGAKAHDKSGAPIVGSCTYDADTKDATATAAEILQGKTAYADGQKLEGSMKNNGSVKGELTTLTDDGSWIVTATVPVSGTRALAPEDES